MDNATITECPGCWEEDCAFCNGGGHAQPEPASWSSMPSRTHAVRISSASLKQMDFLESLLGRRYPDLPDTGARIEAAGIREPINKTIASEAIDKLLKELGPPPPSQKQLDFLESLLQDKDHSFPDEAIELGRTDRKACSIMIDTLMALSRKPKANDKPELEIGMYRDDEGVIFKVYKTVHGNGQIVAKRLVILGGDQAKFEYEGKKPLRHLKPEHRMTLEQAKEFGAIYGVCCVCSRTLTNEDSIEAGIGPICAGRL